MLLQAAKRIAQMILTLILASTVIFVLIHLSGDPTQGFMPAGASPEVREATRVRLGLDQSLPQQYARFIVNGLTGDFGDSWRDNQPALNAVLDRVPATLLLAGSALLTAIVFGILTGVVSASRQSNALVSLVRVVPIVGQAIPTFWLGAMLMLLFAVKLDWLPSSGNATPSSIVLPTATLALHPTAIIARLVSTGMRDLQTSDFVRTARSKGLSARVIALRHVLPNALLPVLAYIGLQAGFLIGGTVVIESVFAWPGIGRLALQSATQRDLPVIHAFVVITAIGVILINIFVDIIRLVVDPRQRSQEHSRGLAHG